MTFYPELQGLVDEATERKLLASYFDNRLIFSDTFQAAKLNICLFQLFRCEDSLLFFVMYE